MHPDGPGAQTYAYKTGPSPNCTFDAAKLANRSIIVSVTALRNFKWGVGGAALGNSGDYRTSLQSVEVAL